MGMSPPSTFGELGDTTFLRQCFSQFLQNIAGGFLSRFYRPPGGSIDALDGPPGMIDSPGGKIVFCGENHTGEHNSELPCEPREESPVDLFPRGSTAIEHHGRNERRWE